MNQNLALKRSFGLLLGHRPKKLLAVFFLTLLQGLGSGFSVVLLIPLLELLGPSTSGGGGRLAEFFNTLSVKTGVALSLETILLAYVAILSLMAFLNYINSVANSAYQQTFIYDLRRRLFRKIIMADWPLLNNKSKTNHLQVLTNEVPALANFYFFLIRLFISLIMTASYIVFALLISVKFTLLITAVGILLFFLLRKYLYKAFDLGEEQLEQYNRLLKYIDDFWQSIKIAKVHSSEQFYYDKFENASSSLLDIEFRMEKNYALPNLISRLSGVLVLVLVVYLGYRFDQVPLTSFFILIVLFARIYPQFTSINTDVNIILSNLPSVKLVMQLDDDFPEPVFEPAPLKVEPLLKKEMAIRNLTFAYPGAEPVLKNFSASISAFSMTGIVGESGIGKTTFIDLVAGLQKPLSGEISIDGIIPDESFRNRWKKSIGYLPQDAFFIDGTLRENLVWDSSQAVADAEITSVLEQVNALHLVERFGKGLDEFISNYAFHFSGGERQRLALARVLLRRPELLLLDEATSSLDAENEELIMQVLSRLSKQVTIIFVTHRSSVLPWFQQVIRIG